MPAVELAAAEQFFYCKGCRYQFSVTSGTVFNDSQLRLQKWFLATLLLCDSREGDAMPTNCGVPFGARIKAPTKSQWCLCHRIRFAMTEVPKMLDGASRD